MGNTAPRAALWALVLLLLAGSLAALPGAWASSTPTYTLSGWVEQPGTLAPVPAGVTVDLLSQATHATYTTTTLLAGGVPSGQFVFSASNTASSLNVGWWGLSVPAQAKLHLTGCNPCAILPKDTSVHYQYYNTSDLTTTAYPSLLPNVSVLPYTTWIFGNATNGATPAVNASVQLLAPQFASLVLANATTNSTGSFNFSAPAGTWVLRTTLPSSPAAFDYQQVTVSGTKMTVNPAISAYLAYGHVYQASAPSAYVPNGGNATVIDTANGNVFTYAVPPGGFYAIGAYPANFTGPGSSTFDVVLSLVGYGAAWYPLTVSPSNTTGGGPRHDVTAPAISPPATYTTWLDFTHGFQNVTVNSTAWLTSNAVFGDLPNASIGQLWGQLALDMSHNLTFSSGDLATLTSWVQAQGPFFPAVQAGTTVNGVAFGVNNTFAFTANSTCAGGCGLTSSATIGYSWAAHYGTVSTVGSNLKNYTLSFAFKHPTNAQAYNYTVKLPAGYVLSAGTNAPSGAQLVPAGPGGTWTSFTLVAKPWASASSIATLPIVKYGNVSAIVNVTATNFAFSTHNVLNSTRGNYTVIGAAGENLTFSAVNSSFPAGTNGTQYTWAFGDATPNNVSSTPSTYHTYAAAGAYDGSLTVTSSGGGISTTAFHVLVGATAPTTVISVNTTVLTAGTVQYALVNSSTTLHFNASTSASTLYTGATVSGVLSIANWSLVSHSFQAGANYTASGSVTHPTWQNFTHTFGGGGYYLNHTVLGGQTITFFGWQYNVTLQVWDAGGHLATATMVILVRDHEKPTPVVALEDSHGHLISSAGVVEGTNHTGEVQLVATNTSDPHNGSVAWYNWTITNPSNASVNISIHQPAVQPGWRLPFRPVYWLAPQAKPYYVNLSVSDQAGNWNYLNVTVSIAVNASTRPVLSVADLNAPSTMTDGDSYTVWVNVTNTLGKNSTAENVSVLFYFLATSGSGAQYPLGGSPGSVQWFHYATNTTTDATPFATGVAPTIPYNETDRAQVTINPGRTGTWDLWVNATATNEFISNYASGANTAHLTVTLNPSFWQANELYIAIAVVVIVVVVLIVLVYSGRLRMPRRGGGSSGGSSKSSSGGSGSGSKSGLERSSKKDDDDDLDDKK